MYYLDFSWTAVQTAGGTLAAGVGLWHSSSGVVPYTAERICRVSISTNTHIVLPVKVFFFFFRRQQGEGGLLRHDWSRMFGLASFLMVNCSAVEKEKKYVYNTAQFCGFTSVSFKKWVNINHQEKIFPYICFNRFERIFVQEKLNAHLRYFCPLLDYQTSPKAQTKSSSLGDGT